MRSGMTAWSTRAQRARRPRCAMLSVPAPSMRAPMRDERRGEVLDLGLAGGVLAARCALGQRRGHHHVLGAGDRRPCRSATVRARAAASARGLDVAVLELDLRAQRREALQVLVDGAGADGAAAGQRDAGLAAAGQQRPEHQHRGAHGAAPGRRAPRGSRAVDVHARRTACRSRRPRSASQPMWREQPPHGADVGQVGDVADGVVALGAAARRRAWAARRSWRRRRAPSPRQRARRPSMRILSIGRRSSWVRRRLGRGAVARMPCGHAARQAGQVARDSAWRTRAAGSKCRTAAPCWPRPSPAPAARPGASRRGAPATMRRSTAEARPAPPSSASPRLAPHLAPEGPSSLAGAHVGRVGDDQRRSGPSAASGGERGRPASTLTAVARRGGPRRWPGPPRRRLGDEVGGHHRAPGPLGGEGDRDAARCRCTGRAAAPGPPVGSVRSAASTSSSVSGPGHEHARVHLEAAAVELAAAGEVLRSGSPAARRSTSAR